MESFNIQIKKLMLLLIKEIRNILHRIISNINQILKIRFSCKNFQRIFKNMIKWEIKAKKKIKIMIKIGSK
jgi:hypothetical protein